VWDGTRVTPRIGTDRESRRRNSEEDRGHERMNPTRKGRGTVGRTNRRRGRKRSSTGLRGKPIRRDPVDIIMLCSPMNPMGGTVWSRKGLNSDGAP
jgi:hypothetical protein